MLIIKTKDFREAANKILLATSLDKTAANLELVAKDNALFLNVTNKEYYVSVKFLTEATEEFRAVVDASLFLNLIAGIDTETFELTIVDSMTEHAVIVKSGKSKYKLAMIYENDTLMKLPVIDIENKTVEMTISNEILTNILEVNSKEIQKAKKLIDVKRLQELYYIDENGCFTFTRSACLNAFKLEKPIKLLLNERIVKLFKLFKEDVDFSFGYDLEADGSYKPRVIFKTADVYVAARTTCDDRLLQEVQGPCKATKDYIDTVYSNHLVLSANELLAAISRILLFTKNSLADVDIMFIPADISFNNDELTITDDQGNTEVVAVENGSVVDSDYTMRVNLADLKSIVDSHKNAHITMNCGNHIAVVINHGCISNVLSEARR